MTKWMSKAQVTMQAVYHHGTKKDSLVQNVECFLRGQGDGSQVSGARALPWWQDMETTGIETPNTTLRGE